MADEIVEGTPVSDRDQRPSREDIYADLAKALAADVAEQLAAGREAFFAYVANQLWAQVQAELAAELRGHDWGDIAAAKESMREPAWEALMGAVDGLVSAGEDGGGYAALLSRKEVGEA